MFALSCQSCISNSPENKCLAISWRARTEVSTFLAFFDWGFLLLLLRPLRRFSCFSFSLLQNSTLDLSTFRESSSRLEFECSTLQCFEFRLSHVFLTSSFPPLFEIKKENWAREGWRFVFGEWNSEKKGGDFWLFFFSWFRRNRKSGIEMGIGEKNLIRRKNAKVQYPIPEMFQPGEINKFFSPRTLYPLGIWSTNQLRLWRW